MKQGTYRLHQYMMAWAVHLFTASTAVIGLLTLYFIYHHNYIAAFWFMGFAIFIDSVDGTLARFFKVKEVVPSIDGALLDNIVDYLNYVITPCFFLLIEPHMLFDIWQWITVCAIALSSTYQFTQSDAKTPDHFFKGFPCYWNIVVFYLFIFQTPPWFNQFALLTFCVLVFVPIKYVYPSRLDYLTTIGWLKKTMIVASLLYGVDTLLLLWTYPEKPLYLLLYAALYIMFYIAFSLFRTAVPLIRARLAES